MKYFAYGSNMDPVRMKARGTDATGRCHAVLKNYSLKFNKMAQDKSAKIGEGKGNIVSNIGESVEGAIYEIKVSGINKLDKFEGYPNQYDKITIQVQLDNESEIEAFTYIAKSDKIRDELKPTTEYLSHYLAAKDILSKEYYEKLKLWPTLD